MLCPWSVAIKPDDGPGRERRFIRRVCVIDDTAISEATGRANLKAGPMHDTVAGMRQSFLESLTLCIKGHKVVELVDPGIRHLDAPRGRVRPVGVKKHDGPLGGIEVLNLLAPAPELVVQLKAGGK